jgi:Rieske Fe-S protein
MNVERRTVLQIGGLVTVGGVIAACGSGSGAAEGSSPPAAAAPGSAAAGGVVTKTSDIPVGGGVILASPAVVITRPTAGDFKAFSAICTHQGCTVASVANNEIICPCHGSKFSAVDGSVVQGPATTALAPTGVTVTSGGVVVSG